MFYAFLETSSRRNPGRVTCFYAAETESEVVAICKNTNGATWVSGEDLARGQWQTFKAEYAAVIRSGRKVS